MSSKQLTREQVLTMLTATPSRISEVTADLLPAQLHTALAPNEWSANEVLAHLRTCADMWGSCIVTMLAQDRPTLRAVNPTTWIKQTDYLEQAFHPSLHAFATQRTELLAVLEPLDQDGWSRAATVTGAGRPLVRTVLFYAEWLVNHERPHIKQIERIVNMLHREQ